jgi:hypothetical protein
MFQYDIADSRDYNRKTDKEHAFWTFLAAIHQDKNSFPFEVENPVLWKGRPNHFRVAGWGGYMSAEGWNVYITYRASRINHVKQHVWSWNNDLDEPTNYRVLEFIG